MGAEDRLASHLHARRHNGSDVNAQVTKLKGLTLSRGLTPSLTVISWIALIMSSLAMVISAFGSFPSLASSDFDQFSFKFGKCTQYRQHQSSCWGGCACPRFSERFE
jgi:hypothetical protein